MVAHKSVAAVHTDQRPSVRLALDVQHASAASDLPSDAQLRRWARAALADIGGSHELTVRIVDAPESAALNAEFQQATWLQSTPVRKLRWILSWW